LLSLQAKNEIKGYYAKNKDVKRFINFMIRKHNFKRSYLIEVFSKASKPRRFKTKRIKRKIVHGVAKGKRWWLRNCGYTRFEKLFVAEDRVREGVKFVKRYKTLLKKIEKKLKVDKYIVTAIIGIESYYGEIRGEWEAFNTLAYRSFKDKRRSRLFKYELENYLLLCYRQKLNALLLKGSKYGALGIGQLLPHNYICYGVSFDGNNRIEPFSNPDSIATVANFLHKKGWRYNKPVAIRASYSGMRFNKLKTNTKRKYTLDNLYFLDILPRKKFKEKRFKLVKLKRAEYDELWLTFKNFDVLKRYNNLTYYAMSVFHLAQEIKRRAKL
jgi:membrane-bound lytic murein transglycosylase B